MVARSGMKNTVLAHTNGTGLKYSNPLNMYPLYKISNI